MIFKRLYFCRWVLVSLDKSKEEEVVVSANPRVPHLSGKKWEVATHKVNVVHEVVKISIIPIMTIYFSPDPVLQDDGDEAQQPELLLHLGHEAVAELPGQGRAQGL